MLRPSIYQIIGKSDNCYSMVIGIAKRAREVADQHYKEKETAKAAAEKRAKANGEQKIRLDDKIMKQIEQEENPVKTAVDEFATGKFKLADPDEASAE